MEIEFLFEDEEIESIENQMMEIDNAIRHMPYDVRIENGMSMLCDD